MPFCPHCNRNAFEIMAVDVGGTTYNCVQCSSCKAPVSFVERDRVEESDEAFETRVTEVLRVVVSSLQTINSRLLRMEQIMQTRK
jgi:transcription elongation factor Elf1